MSKPYEFYKFYEPYNFMNSIISQNITSIIFDLGGVLFDIDYKYTQQAFQQLGATTDFQTVYSQQKQAGIFDEFEKGNISPAQFREGLRQWLPAHITDKQIDNAWNALLIAFPPDKIELLNNLKKKYKLFLLSNTNQIHLPEVRLMADSHKILATGLFIKEYYSCEIRMRKPEKAIYERVCMENNLDVSATLFVDDSIQNIEGQKQ
jgi:glucose-1-phosphatase